LWATLCQCNEELKNSKLITDWKFIVITNGEEKLPSSTVELLRILDNNNKLIHKHYVESLSPPQARQAGVDLADSEYLFFFDNHCLPSRNYFDRAYLFFQEDESNVFLHSATKFYTDDFPCYHYNIKNNLKFNFWGDSSTMQKSNKHYLIAMGGHGGFAVKKSVWNSLGGYGPSELLKGYGGEEPLFDLRMWLKGYKVSLEPKMLHSHYAGDRGYPRHYTEEYYTNMLSAAYVVGGEVWLYRILDSLINNKHIMSRSVPKPSVMAENAFTRCNKFYLSESKTYTKTLDELLEWFAKTGVAY
jgi:hypothetical protein